MWYYNIILMWRISPALHVYFSMKDISKNTFKLPYREYFTDNDEVMKTINFALGNALPMQTMNKLMKIIN